MKHQKLLAAAAALALLCGCGSSAPDAAEPPAPTAQQTATPAQTDGYTDATFADPDAKVTLILNGAKIDCTVAPGVVFYSVYECDNAWETRKSDDAVAGTGAAQKKARKTDGAFYSYVSMNVTGGAEGSGVLNITSTFEGLDTELHLTVNGGSLHILAGLGSEGDGIDSNGYVVINGGTVVALGASMDWAESDGSENAGQAAVNLSFSQRQSADEAIVITDTDGKAVFAYDPDKDEVAESNASWYSGAILSVPGLSVGGDVEGEEVAGGFGGGGGGFDPSGGNGGFDPNGGDAAGEGEVVFSLSEKVNGFTGVRDTE